MPQDRPALLPRLPDGPADTAQGPEGRARTRLNCRSGVLAATLRATLVAGHSAHVSHGTERGFLYDSGDSSTTTRSTHGCATTSAFYPSLTPVPTARGGSSPSRSGSSAATRARPAATTPTESAALIDACTELGTAAHSNAMTASS